MLRGDPSVTTGSVAEYYRESSESISTSLGGGLHFGYWRDISEGGSMTEASQRMTDLVLEKLDVRPGQRVLDVGCGIGAPALRLAQTAGVEVDGVDLSDDHVRVAADRAAKAGLTSSVRFRVSDATRLPFEREIFSGALMLESFFHMPDQDGVLREIARVLHAGSRLVIANLVQRGPLTKDREIALERLWRSGQVAAIHSISEYPDLLTRNGLELEEILDISRFTMEKTFSAIRNIQASQVGTVAPTQSSEDDSPMELFAATPQIGFAIVVARKP